MDQFEKIACCRSNIWSVKKLDVRWVKGAFLVDDIHYGLWIFVKVIA